jgi:hypothetical protein
MITRLLSWSVAVGVVLGINCLSASRPSAEIGFCSTQWVLIHKIVTGAVRGGVFENALGHEVCDNLYKSLHASPLTPTLAIDSIALRQLFFVVMQKNTVNSCMPPRR